LAQPGANKKDFLPDIDEILKENAEHKAVIITSQITIIEVLEASLDASQRDVFSEALNRSWNVLYDVDWPIARKAHDNRAAYQNDPATKKTPSTPDAIHMATAALLQVDEMHTFDDGGKRGFSILAQDGHACVDRIRICKPSAINRPLPGI
jgi:predicted nucleic acid-binding protein